MIDGFTVNGSALVYVGTGSGGALELLGYTDNGVDIQINYNRAEIFTDIYGPMTPHDFQDMGMTARIVVPLIAMDRSVLTKWLVFGDNSGSSGSGLASTGLLNSAGIPMGAGFPNGVGGSGYLRKVAIASPADVGWSFSYCILRPTLGTRLATKANPLRIEFFAIPWQNVTATSAKNAILWTRGSVPS